MAIVNQQRIKPLFLPQPLMVGSIEFEGREEVESLRRYVEELTNQINYNLIPVLDTNGKKVEMAYQPPAILQQLVATDSINHTNPNIPVCGYNAAITLTSTPTISDGYDGEEITIIGTDDTNTLTLQDDSSLSGSNLQLAGGADITLGAGDILVLYYSKYVGDWCEKSRSNN